MSMDSLKITAKEPEKKKKLVPEAVRSKALNKVTMLARKIKAGTATIEDVAEARALTRVIGDKTKPGTALHRAMLLVKEAVEGQLRQRHLTVREISSDRPGDLH